ncbi:hypothetical protein BDQ12DRAFT_725381 [Crucibulum laeve]|uniref:Uncharacterized protein n=1 Tax=Crucibulum laeve TaxID=68775 RepID=A0A5C3LT23_9AGAR|nr:hypothetical protein BDQ12DRAFT_725381 [Crucibulum laeve]
MPPKTHSTTFTTCSGHACQSPPPSTSCKPTSTSRKCALSGTNDSGLNQKKAKPALNDDAGNEGKGGRAGKRSKRTKVNNGRVGGLGNEAVAKSTGDIPAKLPRSEKILEESGVSIAPPKCVCSSVTSLPLKQAFSGTHQHRSDLAAAQDSSSMESNDNGSKYSSDDSSNTTDDDSSNTTGDNSSKDSSEDEAITSKNISEGKVITSKDSGDDEAIISDNSLTNNNADTNNAKANNEEDYSINTNNANVNNEEDFNMQSPPQTPPQTPPHHNNLDILQVHLVQQDQDIITWDSMDGTPVLLVLCSTSDSIQVENPSGSTGTSQVSELAMLQTSLAASDQSDPLKIPKQDLIALLSIPHFVRTICQDISLTEAYQKYKHYHLAIAELSKQVKAGNWPAAYKAATHTDVVELFVSKTSWYDYYKPNFPKVSKFPLMEEWLENEEDRPDDEDVWGFKKTTYTFVDLAQWLDINGKKTKGKKKVTKSGGEGGEKDLKRSSDFTSKMKGKQ